MADILLVLILITLTIALYAGDCYLRDQPEAED